MASSFLTPLDLEYLDGRTWRLTTPFKFRSDDIDATIMVSEGFLTDFASIPRVLWVVLPPTGPYGKAAVVHDWLYKTGLTTRAEADTVLLEGMQVLGVRWFTRQTIYVGVRLGGWVAWRHHRKEDEPPDPHESV